MIKANREPESGTRYFNDISKGMSGTDSKIISERDVVTFAEITGDRNPIHVDADYARDSIFGRRVSHGMLVAGLISAVFGCKFPGKGWIYVNQALQFQNPVFIGEMVTATVIAKKLISHKQMVEFDIIASVEEKCVVTGVATLMSPKRTV
jgi:3-hydroxybutyryl-CoA dehydratase